MAKTMEVRKTKSQGYLENFKHYILYHINEK